MARDCFSVPPGHTMLQFDYSQLELRVAAMESGDELMRQIFLDGLDYHKRTAELVSHTAWGIPPEKVTKAERSQAKAINFGVLYGMGFHALAAQINADVETAERVCNAILGKFKKLDKYCKKQLNEARATGNVWTTWDGRNFRRRPLWRVADADSESRSRAEHGSWNTPIQGKASDYCMFSLVAVVRWLLEEKVPAKLVLPIHDALLFEVRNDAVEELLYTVPRIMCQWPSHGVPLVADADLGTAWGSLKQVVEKPDGYYVEWEEGEGPSKKKITMPWRQHMQIAA
jgi:DNA polymerase-1